MARSRQGTADPEQQGALASARGKPGSGLHWDLGPAEKGCRERAGGTSSPDAAAWPAPRSREPRGRVVTVRTLTEEAPNCSR